MDSSTTSIVNTLGGGSGVDMVKLATDLSEARFAPQIAQLEARNESLEARISAASSLRNQLNQLASALGERMRSGDLAPQATIGDPSVAQVRVQAGSVPRGSYSLEVTQLAASQSLVLDPVASASDPVGEGTVTLRFGTVSAGAFTQDTNVAAVDIEVSAGDDLTTLAGKINASGSGVTAYVASGTDGDQLVLKGAEGAGNGFTLESTGTVGIGWNPATDSGQLRATASDAEFAFDTVAMTSPSNSVSGLPGGLSLALNATNTGAPTRIGFAGQETAIKAVMGDFVAALNDVTASLRDLADPIGGELGADSGARALKRELAGLSLATIMPNAGDGEPSTLSDLGLSVNRDGSFRFDARRLDQALADNPAAVAGMFTTGLHGIYAKMDDLARGMSASKDPGSLAGSEKRYASRMERNEDRLARIVEQQDQLRETMTKQYAAADRNVSLSRSTLSFLETQIAIWNGSNS